MKEKLEARLGSIRRIIKTAVVVGKGDPVAIGDCRYFQEGTNYWIQLKVPFSCTKICY